MSSGDAGERGALLILWEKRVALFRGGNGEGEVSEGGTIVHHDPEKIVLDLGGSKRSGGVGNSGGKGVPCLQ